MMKVFTYSEARQNLSKEALIKSQNIVSRHSGACQNPVNTIVYSALASCVALGLCSRLDSTDSIPGIVPTASMQSWMLVFTSMMVDILNQSFPKLLLLAQEEAVEIRRRDGPIFSLTSKESNAASPFEVPGIITKASTRNILAAVKEPRRG